VLSRRLYVVVWGSVAISPALYRNTGWTLNFGIKSTPMAIFTLRNRTLSPVVELFIECVRATAKSMHAMPEKPWRLKNGRPCGHPRNFDGSDAVRTH